MCASGCLVLGDPEVEETTRSRPQLVAVTPTTELIRVQRDQGTFPVQRFKAELISDDAGEDLSASLLINYGTPGPGGVQPWQRRVSEQSISPGTASDPRTVDLVWIPEQIEPPDCRSVTMLVTHERFGTFPFADCPVDPDDVDTLTWYVAFCENTIEDPDCNHRACAEVPPEGYVYCPRDVEQAYQDFVNQSEGGSP